MSKVVHYGWLVTYPESNEPSDWGTECGLDTFEHYTSNWDNVTCKKRSNILKDEICEFINKTEKL